MSNNLLIFASFENQKINDPESNFINFADRSVSFLNTQPEVLSYTIYPRPYDGDNQFISITSNGIDGIGFQSNTFNIPKINFTGQKIYFVARAKTNDYFPNKSLNFIEKEEVAFLITHTPNFLITHNNDFLITRNLKSTIELVRPNGSKVAEVSAFSNLNELSAYNKGGYFKGYIVCPITGRDFRIKVSTSFGEAKKEITGYSSYFDILSAETLDVRKINEDKDETENFKSLIFQDALLDKPMLFDSFIGQIVGSDTSDPETLGIKKYEKIANFVSNNVDIDYCNFKAQQSLLKELDINFEEYNQQFPASLKRLVDIFCIGLSKQLGEKNNYQFNFDDKGVLSKNFYGKNKGIELKINTTILNTGSASKYIIGYERFSEKYLLLNTNILSASNIQYLSANAYALSSYNNSWGWELVLPSDITPEDLTKYYRFYEFNDNIEGSYLQKFIDFDNPLNTYLTTITSFSDYAMDGGVIDSYLSKNILTNLRLLSSN
jgi:hypothetical protein